MHCLKRRKLYLQGLCMVLHGQRGLDGTEDACSIRKKILIVHGLIF